MAVLRRGQRRGSEDVHGRLPLGRHARGRVDLTGTFAALLADQLRRSASRPLVTFYDDATGERAELSVATYSNWVAKTAGLLQDELGLARGDTVLVDLPVHWLAPVCLGAVWSTGGVVVGPATPDPGVGPSGGPGADVGADVVVCGPAGLGRYAGSAAGAGVPVVALSLRPMGARFAEPLPDGVLDYGLVVWGQPDSFTCYDPPDAEDLAWSGPGTAWAGSPQPARLTQRQVVELELPAGTTPVPEGGSGGTRLLTDLDPVSPAGLAALVAPLRGDAGTVWVAHAADDSWEARAAAERTTHVVRRPAG